MSIPACEAVGTGVMSKRLPLHDPLAHWLVIATGVAVAVGEIVATYPRIS